MRKSILFAVVVLLFVVTLSSQNAHAQSSSEVPKVEIGAQYTLLRAASTNPNTESFNGLGGVFAYNFTDNLGADASFNFFIPKMIGAADNKFTQGFFGVKTGLRSEKAGIFAKVRPGFFRFTVDSSGVSTSRNYFAMDVGGVVEVYSSRKLGFRFDIGDTIIKYSSATTNNLQIGAGVMLRF